MARPGDRRPVIADHAIEVLAEGGARALSHHAVDRAAGLAVGSTSYYFRTRRDLVDAAIGRIKSRSRAAFDGAHVPRPGPITARAAANLMADQLQLLTSSRRSDALAVFALVPEVEEDAESRARLAGCLFSREMATDLLGRLGARDAERASLDLVDFLTGILFGSLFGQRRAEGVRLKSIADTLERFIVSNIAGTNSPDAHSSGAYSSGAYSSGTYSS